MVNFKHVTAEDVQLWTQLNREFMSFELAQSEGEGDVWNGTDKVGDDVFAADFKMIFDNPEMGELVIIYEDEQPIGFINILTLLSVWAHGRALLIDDLYIREGCRGRGYGKASLEYCEELARSRGYSRVQLLAEDANENAGEFYNANGYDGDGVTLFMKYFK